MENQTPTPNPESAEQTAANAHRDLVKELRELADTLEQAARQAVTSDKLKELEEEVRQGFSKLRQQTDSALKQAKVSDAAQGFGSQAKKVAGRAADARPVKNLLTVLAGGVAAVNQQLHKYLDETRAAADQTMETAEAMTEPGLTADAQATMAEVEQTAQSATKKTKAKAEERIEEGKGQLEDAGKAAQHAAAEASDTAADVAKKLES